VVYPRSRRTNDTQQQRSNPTILVDAVLSSISKTDFVYPTIATTTTTKVAPTMLHPSLRGCWVLLFLSLWLLPWDIVPFTTTSHSSLSCLALAFPHQSSLSSSSSNNNNSIASRNDNDDNPNDNPKEQQQQQQQQEEDKVQSSIAFLSPFGSYPNPLQLTEQDRAKFHPVMKYPKAIVKRYTTTTTSTSTSTSATIGDEAEGITLLSLLLLLPVNDYRFKSGSLATEQERKFRHQTRVLRHWKRSILQLGRRLRKYWRRRRLLRKKDNEEDDNHHDDDDDDDDNYSYSEQELDCFRLGRYDENRIALYSSELFQDVSNQIDGYSGARTVHLGIDLGAPALTPIYTFDTGIIHSMGYNPALGDYGHVIVIQYNTTTSTGTTTPYWALYGHLDRASTTSTTTNKKKSSHPLRPGQVVQKGDVIGWIGDMEDNGGWYAPHLHFQISLQEPTTHDMPGAVSVPDRDRALIQYPDPRYVLGPLY
jgi:peptidoglycan LD-endopeptidase LytH